MASTPEFSHLHITVLDNPDRIVPCALNIGIKEARGKYIIRMDAHSEYAPDYISKCVEWLEKADAVNVGGPMIAVGIIFCFRYFFMLPIVFSTLHFSYGLGSIRGLLTLRKWIVKNGHIFYDKLK